MNLTALSFLAPWALGAALALPVLWWLLRVTPPAPREVRFPAIRLLLGLGAREETPAKTPLWLVLLRMLVAVLVILGVAHPVLDAPTAARDQRPLLLVVDDGWAAAADWPERRARLETLLDAAARGGRRVMLLPTAPPADGGNVAVSAMMTADQARSLLPSLEPKPWPVDRAAAEAALRGAGRGGGMQVVWLTDGVAGAGADGLARQLQILGRVEALVPPPARLPKQLLPPAADAAGLAPVVRRVSAAAEETVTVRALDAAGRVLERRQVRLPAGERATAAAIGLPTELRNRVARLDLAEATTAAGVALVDEGARRRPVGLVTAGAAPGTPLLDPLHYVGRALAPFAEVRRAPVGELLRRPLAVAVLPETVSLGADERARLRDWIEAGGTLLRFAGPSLADAPDDLLPVRLRAGGRTLGGALSWTEPAGLAPFPADKPFAGLDVPDDVRVEAQVLAEPELGLDEKTWARLADGTPLVTADRLGRGRIVLVHTTATPAWGDLALSRLFVDLLRRVVLVSEGVRAESGDAPLPPLELLDAFGAARAPGGVAAPLPAAGDERPAPGPRHPPGFYGSEAARHAFNLAPALPPPAPLTLPRGVTMAAYDTVPHSLDLRPWLLAAALALAVVDLAIALALRGVVGRRPATAAGLGLLALIGVAPEPALAQEGGEQFALAAALTTRLAYVEVGDPGVDDVSHAGLSGLTMILDRRTAAELGEPAGVDVERDPLVFFPLLYWPITPQQPPLSEEARAKVNEYMRNGGMILFDTRDQDRQAMGGEGPESGAFRDMAEGLAVPPLAPVDEDHVLARAFYLLRELPGRFDGGTVWVARDGVASSNDGVSPVIIGSHDWAGAWAVDEGGRPLFATAPGGERQRELAYRFGVNAVMYALTGNYKGDQVHLPTILDRLGQ